MRSPHYAVRRVVVLLGALALLLVLAPAALANVNLAGKSTTLKLNGGTAKALTGAGIGVGIVKPAKATKGGPRFAITGGSINPETLAGTIKHSGGLRFSHGKTTVTAKNFNIVIGKKPRLTAAVGKARLTLADLSLKKAKIRASGFNTNVSGVAVTLSSGAAKALNSAFGTHLFKKGIKLGTAKVAIAPAEIELKGGKTSLALDAGTVATLGTLGVTPGFVAPSTGPEFAITGGKVNLKTLAGTIDHNGGLTLTKGGVTVKLSDFVIDTVGKVLTAKVNDGARAPIADLDLSAPQVSTSGKTVTVGNVKVTLSQTGAAALNQAFGVSAFTNTIVLGVATVHAEAK